MDDDFESEQELPIKHLEFEPPSRHDEGHIDRIAESIAIGGLINPIVVHPVAPNRWKVDAGEGRIHAHIRLGRKTVRARIYKYNPLLNRLRHIDENIARVEVKSHEWDRLVTERIEIVKQLDPKNRAIKNDRRTPKTETDSDAPRQKVNAVYEVAKELNVQPRTVEMAKARVEKAVPEVAKAHAAGDLKSSQVDQLIKIEDPFVQAETAVKVVGMTKEETASVVAEIVKTPDERLTMEMNSAVKLASALTTRLQTIKRLTEIEGMGSDDVTRARFADAIEGLKLCL